VCALRRIYDIYTGMYKSQDKDDDLQGMSILPTVFILHALTLRRPTNHGAATHYGLG